MNTKSKRRLLAGVVFLGLISIVLVRIAFLPAVPDRVGVTEDNFHRIRFGMSFGEVCTIIGPPRHIIIPHNSTIAIDGEPCQYECWVSEDMKIMVYYTDGHGVFRKVWSDAHGHTVEDEDEFQPSRFQRYWAWLRGVIGFE